MVICHRQQGKVIHASTSVKWTKKENGLVTPEPQPAPNRQGRELRPGQLGGGHSLLKPRGPGFKSHREGDPPDQRTPPPAACTALGEGSHKCARSQGARGPSEARGVDAV